MKDVNFWSRLPELNRRPSNYESDALPTELSRPGGQEAQILRRIALYECELCSVKLPCVACGALD
jgi:hypothetical protein